MPLHLRRVSCCSKGIWGRGKRYLEYRWKWRRGRSCIYRRLEIAAWPVPVPVPVPSVGSRNKRLWLVKNTWYWFLWFWTWPVPKLSKLIAGRNFVTKVGLVRIFVPFLSSCVFHKPSTLFASSILSPPFIWSIHHCPAVVASASQTRHLKTRDRYGKTPGNLSLDSSQEPGSMSLVCFVDTSAL